jgi:hypothetical protein
MKNFTRTSGICISRKYENEEFYQLIKNSLTRHSKDYQKSTFTTNYYFLEGTNILKVPRYYPIEKYCSDYDIVDNTNSGQDIQINHHITLRDDLQKNIVKYFLTNSNGIIQANPGSGKTIVSIYAVSTLKKKTFILVHRDSLVLQWENGFLNYTDISKDQIGRLSSHNFKDVLKKSIIICTDQTFVSILKRNREEFLIELNNANIGVLIGDEVHTTVGAPTFAECSLHIPTSKAFGLSATPKRWDGNLDVMKFHLGEVFIPEGKSSTMDTRVTVLLCDFGFLPKSYAYLYWGGFFQKSRYSTILKNSKLFMSIVLSLLNKFTNDNRQILFIGERIKLLELLKEKCLGKDKGLFIAGSDLKEIEKQITFSTPNKSRDGVDYVSKDCLIMSSPIGNIEQMCGRVLRIKEGKAQPIVIDIVDIGVKAIRETFFSRLEFYKLKKWSVQFVFITNTGVKNIISEDQAIQIIRGE